MGQEDDDASLAELLEELRDEFREEGFDSFYQSLGVFGVTPGFSNASYKADGDTIKSIKIPYRRTFKEATLCLAKAQSDDPSDYVVTSLERSLDPDKNTVCAKPYGELALSYLRADAEIEEFDPELESSTGIDIDVEAVSALAGIGLSIPLYDGTVLRPILLGGYSHITDRTTFKGEDGPLLDLLTNRIAFNVDVNNILIGGAVELQYDQRFANDTDLRIQIRYNHLASHGFRASDESLETTNSFGLATANMESSIPTGSTLFSRDLRVVGSIGGAYLPWDQAGNAIDINYLGEIGGGIELRDDTLVTGIEGFRIRVLKVVGDSIDGWKFGLSLRF